LSTPAKAATVAMYSVRNDASKVGLSRSAMSSIANRTSNATRRSLAVSGEGGGLGGGLGGGGGGLGDGGLGGGGDGLGGGGLGEGEGGDGGGDGGGGRLGQAVPRLVPPIPELYDVPTEPTLTRGPHSSALLYT
jgi:hypothetical protein